MVWHDESTVTPRLTVYDLKTKVKSYIIKDVDSAVFLLFTAIKSCGVQIPMSTYVIYLHAHRLKIAAGSNPDIYGNKVS